TRGRRPCRSPFRRRASGTGNRREPPRSAAAGTGDRSCLLRSSCFPQCRERMISSKPSHRRGKHMELKGKVAVVTGGNGGLGQRICHALAREGCHIAVVYAASKDQAEGVAKDLA